MKKQLTSGGKGSTPSAGNIQGALHKPVYVGSAVSYLRRRKKRKKLLKCCNDALLVKAWTDEARRAAAEAKRAKRSGKDKSGPGWGSYAALGLGALGLGAVGAAFHPAVARAYVGGAMALEHKARGLWNAVSTTMHDTGPATGLTSRGAQIINHSYTPQMARSFAREHSDIASLHNYVGSAASGRVRQAHLAAARAHEHAAKGFRDFAGGNRSLSFTDLSHRSMMAHRHTVNI